MWSIDYPQDVMDRYFVPISAKDITKYIHEQLPQLDDAILLSHKKRMSSLCCNICDDLETQLVCYTNGTLIRLLLTKTFPYRKITIEGYCDSIPEILNANYEFTLDELRSIPESYDEELNALIRHLIYYKEVEVWALSHQD